MVRGFHSRQEKSAKPRDVLDLIHGCGHGIGFVLLSVAFAMGVNGQQTRWSAIDRNVLARLGWAVRKGNIRNSCILWADKGIL